MESSTAHEVDELPRRLARDVDVSEDLHRARPVEHRDDAHRVGRRHLGVVDDEREVLPCSRDVGASGCRDVGRDDGDLVDPGGVLDDGDLGVVEVVGDSARRRERAREHVAAEQLARADVTHLEIEVVHERGVRADGARGIRPRQRDAQRKRRIGGGHADRVLLPRRRERLPLIDEDLRPTVGGGCLQQRVLDRDATPAHVVVWTGSDRPAGAVRAPRDRLGARDQQRLDERGARRLAVARLAPPVDEQRRGARDVRRRHRRAATFGVCIGVQRRRRCRRTAVAAESPPAVAPRRCRCPAPRRSAASGRRSQDRATSVVASPRMSSFALPSPGRALSELPTRIAFFGFFVTVPAPDPLFPAEKTMTSGVWSVAVASASRTPRSTVRSSAE